MSFESCVIPTESDHPKHSPGFSLLELLVGLGLSMIMAGSLLALMMQFMKFEQTLVSLIRRDRGLLAVSSLLSRYLVASGNGSNFVIGLEIGGGTITARSNLDGPASFPDGTLAQSFESVSLRAERGGLQVRSGRGGFQTLVSGIESLHTARPSQRLIRASVTAITDLDSSLLHDVGRAELEFDIFLWNYRPLLFPPGARAGARLS